MLHDDVSPVSFPVSVKVLPTRGLPVEIRADAKARAAMAELHGLEAVKSFEADMLVSRWKKEGVRITGTVRATVVQLCVVTLEPLTGHVEAEIDSLFVPENSRLSRVSDGHGEIIIDVEGDDLPEPFEGNEIDAGALAEEYFELSIDPYPRKPGVALDGPAGDLLPERENPFAKLASLRKDEGK